MVILAGKSAARRLDGCLCSSKAGDGNTVGRAGDVVQTNIVAELNAGGVAAVLAADAQTQVRVGGAAVSSSHLDQLADTNLIQMLERIALVNLVVIVGSP